jgi:hypothetical protein
VEIKKDATNRINQYKFFLKLLTLFLNSESLPINKSIINDKNNENNANGINAKKRINNQALAPVGKVSKNIIIPILQIPLSYSYSNTRTNPCRISR